MDDSQRGPAVGRDSLTHGVRAGAAALSSFIVCVSLLSNLGNGAVGLFYRPGAGGDEGAECCLNTGIAGLILSVGMAVDANVIILSGQEKLRRGHTIRPAVKPVSPRPFIQFLTPM